MAAAIAAAVAAVVEAAAGGGGSSSSSTPAPTNSFTETLANIFTPNDGASYVGGQLVDDNTGEAISAGGTTSTGNVVSGRANSTSNDDDGPSYAPVTSIRPVARPAPTPAPAPVAASKTTPAAVPAPPPPAAVSSGYFDCWGFTSRNNAPPNIDSECFKQPKRKYSKLSYTGRWRVLCQWSVS